MDNKEGRPTPDYLPVAAATAAVAAGVSCVSLPVLAATAESAHSQLLLDQISLPSMFHIVRSVLGQQPAPCYSSFPSTSSPHNSPAPPPPPGHQANPWSQVAPLSGGRRLTVRFRPSKRALGKLNEGHPDAHDSPAVPQLRYPSKESTLHCISVTLLSKGWQTTSFEGA